MKKIASLILVGALASGMMTSTGFAATSESNLDSYIEMAKSSNSEWKLISKQLEREYDDYRTTINTSKAITPGKEDDEGYSYDEKVIMELDPLQADKDLADMRYDELQSVHSLTLDTIEYYYTFINMKDKVNFKEEDYSFMKQEFEAKKMEFELGQITELALNEFEKTYKDAYLEYLTAKKDFDNYKAQFNIFLGKEPTAALNIAVAAVPSKEFETVDLDSLIAEAVENSYQIDQLEKNIAIQEKTRDLKSRFKGFGDVAVELEQIEDDIFNYTNKIATTTLQLKYDVISKYNDVLIANEDIQIQNLQFDIAKKQYDVAKLKYDNGLVSQFDYLESKIDFENAYYDSNAAKLDYYLAVSEFENFLSENTVEIANE